MKFLHSIIARANENRIQWYGGALILAIFCMAHVGIPIGGWGDSPSYLWLRDKGFNQQSLTWFYVIRPPMTPILYAIFRTNQLATMAQEAISFLSWLLLAIATKNFFRPKLIQNFAFVIVLTGCIGQDVLFWNRVISSESLSTSFMCVFLALLLQSITNPKVMLLSLSGVALALTRDSWIYFIPLAAMAIFCGRISRKKLLAYASTVILSVSAHVITQPHARQVYPTRNIVFLRILGDPRAEAFFVRSGMPDIDEIRQKCKGKYSDKCASPGSFNDWVRVKGQSTYRAWLADSMATQLANFWNARAQLIAGDLYAYDSGSPIRPPFNSFATYLSCIGRSSASMMWGLGASLVISLLACLYVTRKIKPTPPLMSAAILAIAFMANIFICYLGDGMEIGRHVILPFVGLQFSMVVGVLAFAEQAS